MTNAQKRHVLYFNYYFDLFLSLCLKILLVFLFILVVNYYLQGKVALVSAYGIHQLHIFIFVLAIFHILYCIITYALGKTKVHDIFRTFFTSAYTYVIMYVFNLVM